MSPISATQRALAARYARLAALHHVSSEVNKPAVVGSSGISSSSGGMTQTPEAPVAPMIDKNFTPGAPVYLDVNGMFTTKKSDGARALMMVDDPLTQQLTMKFADELTAEERKDSTRQAVMNVNTYRMLNYALDSNWTPSAEDYQKFPDWMKMLRAGSVAAWKESKGETIPQSLSDIMARIENDVPILNVVPQESYQSVQAAQAAKKYKQAGTEEFKTSEGTYLLTPEEKAQLNRGEVRLPGQYTIFVEMEDGSYQPLLVSFDPITKADKTFVTFSRPEAHVMQPMTQAAKSNPFAALANSLVKWSTVGITKLIAEAWNVLRYPVETGGAGVVGSLIKGDNKAWSNWWGYAKSDQTEILRQLDNASKDVGNSWKNLVSWLNQDANAQFNPMTTFEATTQTNIPFIMGGAENAVPMGMMGFNEQQNEINKDVAQTRQIAAMEEARLNEASNSLFAESLAIIRSGTNDPKILEKATEATRKAIEIDMRTGYVDGKYGFATVNPYYAFSETAKPEEHDRFVNNLVLASLQKQAKGLGTHLTEFEVFKIKEVTFDPGIEMVGNMLYDWTNIVDFGPVVEALKGAKALSKFSSSVSDAARVVIGKSVKPLTEARAWEVGVNGVAGGVTKTAFAFHAMKTAIKSQAAKEAAIANDVFTSIAKATTNPEQFIDAMDDVAEVAIAAVKGTAAEELISMPASIGKRQLAGMSEIANVISPDKWKVLAESAVKQTSDELDRIARLQITRTMRRAGRDVTSVDVQKIIDDAVKKSVADNLKPKIIVPQFADMFRKEYLNKGRIWRNSDLLYDGFVGQLVKLSGGKLAEPTSKFGNIVRWVSQLSTTLMNGWYQGVLSLRPAWVIRNYQDNVGRFVIAGGKFGGDLSAIIESLPGGIPPAGLFQSMQSRTISDPTSPIYRLLNDGTKFKSFFDFYTYRIKEVYRGFPKAILPKADLTVPQNVARSGWKILEAGVVNPFRVLSQGTGDWNSYVEFSFRVRLYHTKYTENIAKLRPLFEGENLAKLPEEFRAYGRALLDASNNDPIRMSQLLKLQDETETVIFSYLIPDNVEKIFADASPVDRQLFLIPVQQRLAEWLKAYRANGKVPTDADVKKFFTEMIEQAKEANDNIARMGNEVRQNPIDLSRRPTPGEDEAVIEEVLEGTTEKPSRILPNPEARKMWNEFRNKGIKPDEAELRRVLEDNGVKLPPITPVTKTVDELITTIKTWGIENPLNRQNLMFDGVQVKITSWQGKLQLDFIGSFPSGKGNASKALDRIVEAADQAGIDIELNAVALGKDGLKQKDLVAWYKRHGFEIVGANVKEPRMVHKAKIVTATPSASASDAMKKLEELVKKNDKPTVEPKKVPEKKVTVTSSAVNSDVDFEDLTAHNEAMKARGRLLTPKDEQWTEEYKLARDAQMAARVDMTERIKTSRGNLPIELREELGDLQLELSDWMDKNRKMIYAMFPWGSDWNPDTHQFLWRRFEVYRTTARQAQAALETQISEAIDEMVKTGVRSDKLDIDPIKLFREGGIDIKVDGDGMITELTPLIEVDGMTPRPIRGPALGKVLNDLMPKYDPRLSDIDNFKGLVGDTVTRDQMLHHIPPMVTVKKFDGKLAAVPNIAETFQTKKPPATMADFQDPLTFVDPDQTPLKTKQWVVLTAEYPMNLGPDASKADILKMLDEAGWKDIKDRDNYGEVRAALMRYNKAKNAELEDEIIALMGGDKDKNMLYKRVDGNYGKVYDGTYTLPDGVRTEKVLNDKTGVWEDIIIENSFLVPGVSAEQALRLAKKYNQESVLTNMGFVYQNGRVDRTTDIVFESPDNVLTSYFTKAKIGDKEIKFQSDFPWRIEDSILTELAKERGRSAFVDTVRRVAIQYRDSTGRIQLKSTNDVALANILKKHLKEVYPKMELPEGNSLQKVVDAMIDFSEKIVEDEETMLRKLITTPEQFITDVTNAFNSSAQRNYERSLPKLVKGLKEGSKKVMVEEMGYTPEYVDDLFKLFDSQAENWARLNNRPAEEFWYTKFAGVVKRDARLSLEGKWLYLTDAKGNPTPVWYSPLEKVVENGLTDKRYPDGMSVIKRIRSLPGIKKEELEITGVFDWLADLTPEEIAKGIQLADGTIATSLTPEVVLDYIRQHELSWEEVWQGSDTAVMAGMGRQAKYKIVDRHPEWQEHSLPTNMNDENLKFNWFATFPNMEKFTAGHYSGIKNLEQWVRGDVVEIDKNITALLINEVQSDIDEMARDAAKQIRWNLYEHYRDRDVLRQMGIPDADTMEIPDISENFSAMLGTDEKGKPIMGNKFMQWLQSVATEDELALMKTGGYTKDWDNYLNAKVKRIVGEWMKDEDNAKFIDDLSIKYGDVKTRLKNALDPNHSAFSVKDRRDAIGMAMWRLELENTQTLRPSISQEIQSQVDVLQKLRTSLDPNISPSIGRALDDMTPRYPFSKNYTEVAFKRMLRKAVDDGHEYLTWTTGEQQIERWNRLRLGWEEQPDGAWKVFYAEAVHDDGTDLVPKLASQTYIVREFSDVRSLPGEIGDSWAETLWKEIKKTEAAGKTSGSYRPLEEGMVNFYDKEPIRLVEEWNKKYGLDLKVEDVTYSVNSNMDPAETLQSELAIEAKIIEFDGDYAIVSSKNGESYYLNDMFNYTRGTPDLFNVHRFSDLNGAQQALDRAKRTGEMLLQGKDLFRKDLFTVHGIKITDKAREWAEGGLPLFLQDPKTYLKRAATVFDKTGRGAMVGLLDAQNPFDAIHELMHVGLTAIPAGDWPVVSKWLGELPEHLRVNITGDQFFDMHQQYIDGTISSADFKIYSKASENINNGIVKTLIEDVDDFVSPEVKSVLQRIVAAIKKWYEDIIGGTLYEVELNPEVRKVFRNLFDKIPDTPAPQVVQMSDDMTEIWKVFQIAPGADGKTWREYANHARVKWDGPNEFLQSLKDIGATETDPNIADYYRTLAAKAEGQLRKLEETSQQAIPGPKSRTKKIPTPIPDAKLPLEYQSWLAMQRESVTSMNRAINALIEWQDSLSDSFAKAAKGEPSEFFFSKQKPKVWETMQSWADETARDLQEMINTASEGGTYKGMNLTGALGETNDAMLDYTHWNQWENIMRAIYPFWMFPSRSTVFWAKTLSTHPAIAMWYQKYMLMSERQVYQNGLVTSRGEPLPSFRGYVKIAGTDIWFNPTAALSFRYVLNPLMGFMAGDNASVSDTGEEEVGPLTSVVRELYRVGLDYGFQPSPLFSFIPIVQEGLGAGNTSAQTIIPMLELLPLNWRRNVVDGLRIKSPSLRNAIAAEPPWKNYLVENKMLKDALQTIMTETEDSKRYATAMNVLNVFTTTDSLGNPTRETNQDWLDARADLEKSQLWQKYTSYFTSFYGKPYTDADAALQDLREENNLLRSMINNEIGAYLFNLDSDAVKRYDDYIHNAYDTPEGAIYRLRQSISWVTDEEGNQITDPENRLRRLNQILSDDSKRDAKFEALHESRMLYEEEMANVPLGAPYELKQPILERYWERNQAINSNPDYVTLEDSPEWNPINKPEDKILDHYRYNWYQDLRTLLDVYDPTKESYDDYKLRKEAWEKDFPKYASDLAKRYKDTIEADMVKLFPMLGWDTYTKGLGEEAPGVTLADRIVQQLISETTPEGLDNYYRKNDTINEALSWAWEELYANKYWEMVGDKSGDERTIATNQFYTLYPASSITPQMLAEKVMSHPVYAKRGWSMAEIVSAYMKSGYMDVEESQETSKSEGDKQVSEVFDYLGFADPGKEYSALVDKVKELGGSDVADDLQLLYTPGGTTLLAQPKNADRLAALLQAVKYAVASLGIEQPSDTELVVRVEAKDQNDLYKAKAMETLGDDIFEISAVYYSMSYSGQKEFRTNYPKDYERILALSKFKDMFGLMYPLWQSFYDPTGTKSTSPSGGSGTNFTSTSKSTSSYSSTSSQSSGYQLRDDFLQMGKRYSLDFRALLSGYNVGKAGVVGDPEWPQEMIDALGEMFFKEAVEVYEAKEKLSESAEQYLEAVVTHHPEWTGPIGEIKRVINENVSPGVGGGKWVMETQ